jgi:hypothetical protein
MALLTELFSVSKGLAKLRRALGDEKGNDFLP